MYACVRASQSTFDRMRVKAKILVGFYQILLSVTTTLDIRWPNITLRFLIYMRLFTIDLPVLPFVGCLNRSSFVNSFFVTVLSPPSFIALMIVLRNMGILSMLQVWRNSIYLLFLCYPRTCETIVNAFRCYKLVDDREFLLEDFNIKCDKTYKACSQRIASQNKRNAQTEHMAVIGAIRMPYSFFHVALL